MSVVILATTFSLAVTVLCLKRFNIELYSNVQDILDALEIEPTQPFHSRQTFDSVESIEKIATPVPVRKTPTPEFLIIS